MNRWSLKLAEPFGIAVYVHASFLLIVAWVALGQLRAGGGLGAMLVSVLFLLAIFACVALHELGHALAARRYGIRTRDIILLPIGGLARLERMPEKPGQELVVALAGPAVNVAIALALGVWLALTGPLAPGGEIGFLTGPFIERLLVVNVGLVLFNLLPAFPMDGGRVLRALLAMRLGPLRATRIAGAVGKGMAALFAVFGVFYNPFLLLIAFFIWSGATQETHLAAARARADRFPPGQVIEVVPMTSDERERTAARLEVMRSDMAAAENRLRRELDRLPRG